MSVYNFPQFLRRMMEAGLEAFGMYYGVYRAEVKDNQDPTGLGRLKIQCDLIHGAFPCENWAWPQAPWASSNCGLWGIPDVGDFVYVVFDHGRADQPIWFGGWWAEGEPHPDMKLKNVVLATKEGMKVVFDRTAKTVTVEQKSGTSVVMSDSSLAIKHATKVTIDSQEIDLNGKVNVIGDMVVQGNGAVQGNWYAQNNSAHHTHPISNGIAIKNDP